ncbi:xanthine dehydrogenase family protein molybdopterin-binding subunit [Sulfobacillus thermosulfidooxidans]|uniref:xanthine dehydrogenase family protein molybdopterin-binding subunit n=1 Tax=Sulfobacillus thermosulfidooxidans TaxID=28034 RepID=UPI0002ECBBB6|nr:xanthine dehydrogenase family protein molybdopterin-binding subunit [Sulfobacillus thermosulfidooxidans]
MASHVLTPTPSIIGQKVIREDVRKKVAGEVLYSADWVMPGMLYAKLVRALYPHAKITKIDSQGAYQVPGVVRVIEAKDVPVNQFYDDPSGLGEKIAQHKVFQDDEVRYVGEPICLVVAKTPEAAEKGAEAIWVDYDILPSVHDPLEALKEDAPLVHPHGNTVVEWNVHKGDVDAVIQDPGLVHIQRTYRTGFVDHLYLEPESGVGWIDNDGIVTLRCATQVLEHYRDIARMLNLPENRVRVICPYVGGGFGGKEDMTVEPYLAIATWITQKPVKMVWSRQESLLARPKRHPFIMTYDVWAKPQGELVAMKVDITGDAGAYAMLSPRVLFAAAVVATGPYRIDHVDVKSRAVYTHNVPTSAFRGFGAMQMAFGYEQIMEEIAQELGIDAVEFRRCHFIRKGDKLATGEIQDTAVWLNQTLDKVLEELGDAPVPADSSKRIGRGIACTMQPYGRTVWFHDHASCWLNLESDGSVVLRIGVPDIGGGQAASLCQIAAEILHVPLEDVRPYYGDSALTPLAGGTFATRQLYMSGNAVVKAALALQEKIEQVLTMTWGEHQWQWQDGFAHSGSGLKISRSAIYEAANALHSPLSVHTTFHAETGEGYDNRKGRAFKTFPDFTFGCHGAVVEVDEETGAVKVLRYVASHDVGVAINPLSVEGQIHGGVVQGLGYALSEEVIYQEGQCVTTLFSQYMVPTAKEMPDITAIILESHEGKGPFHARGIGEPAISPVAPAVANAIANALGSSLRVRSLPMTAEKIWRELSSVSQE